MYNLYEFTEQYKDSLRYVAERAYTVQELKDPKLRAAVYNDKIKDMITREDDDLTDFILYNLGDADFREEFRLFLESQVSKKPAICRNLDSFVERDIDATMEILVEEDPITEFHFKESLQDQERRPL